MCHLHFELDIYDRYLDDTFIPWLHGIGNLLNFEQALDEHIKSIKPTDNHEYLDVQLSHQQAAFRSILRTVANRVRRNCTDDSEFVRAKSEYFSYLLRAGYNISFSTYDQREPGQSSLLILHLSKHVSLRLHPHTILLLVKYT